MRNVIAAAAMAAFLFAAARADDYWGNCTRSPAVSPELRIRDCTIRVDKGANMFFDDRESLLRRGQAYLDSGQYRLAIADYDHSLAPNMIGAVPYADARLQRAVAYAFLRDFPRAEQDLDAALSEQEATRPPANDPLLAKIRMARGLLVAVRNGIQSADVLRQVMEATVHQE